jgi:hypothetical protein
MKNITFLTTLDLFTNYLDHPERVDVDWQIQLNMKVNEFISANVHTHLIYDYDVVINEKNGIVQFKELFGAGLSYKF